MSDKVYQALKNHVHNTLKISRDELKAMVREAVKEMTKDALDRYFQTGQFRYDTYKSFDWLLGQKMFEIKTFCAHELTKRYEVTVTSREGSQ